MSAVETIAQFLVLLAIVGCLVGSAVAWRYWWQRRPWPEPAPFIEQERVWVNWNEPELWVAWAGQLEREREERETPGT